MVAHPPPNYTLTKRVANVAVLEAAINVGLSVEGVSIKVDATCLRGNTRAQRDCIALVHSDTGKVCHAAWVVRAYRRSGRIVIVPHRTINTCRVAS